MAKTTTPQNDNIIDIDLSIFRKKRFRINKDDNAILELDTSDLSVVNRLQESYPKLTTLEEKMKELTEQMDAIESEDGTEFIKVLSQGLTDIDKQMRDIVDFIFDSNVCEVCVPSGTMYDPFNGKLRYEHLISILSGLYEQDLAKEMAKVHKQMTVHTSKYIK